MIKKIMMGLAATNADASRPTGTPTACAKIWDIPQTNRGGGRSTKRSLQIIAVDYSIGMQDLAILKICDHKERE